MIKTIETSLNTVVFTFTSEYVEQNDIIDYFCEYDDENQSFIVYVNDVSDVLIQDLNEHELCEFFGLDSEYLVHTTVD